MRKSIPLVCVLLVIVAAGIAGAATETVNGSIASSKTNWLQNLSIQGFDSSLGTLTGITLTLTGHIDGLMEMENMESYADQVQCTVNGVVTLERPDSTELSHANPQSTLH